ncbi:MAG: hypothetical protein WCJ11_07430 [Methylococcaceae bacterium]
MAEMFFRNVEKIQFSDAVVNLDTTQSYPESSFIRGKKGYWANETIVGTSGDDVIDGTGGNDDIDGGAGIDTVLIFAPKEKFKITSLPGMTRMVDDGSEGLKYDMAEMFFRNVEKVQFSDGLLDLNTGNFTQSNTTTPINLNILPTGTLEIIGTAQQNQTLSVRSTVADADGLGAFINYQWLSNGEVISGATKLTYTLMTEDVGKNISVKVSYTDLKSHAESVTSGTTALVTGTQNTVTPTVTLSSNAANVNEGSSVTYTATLSSAATTAVSIPYSLRNTSTSTSVALDDFIGLTVPTGTIYIPVGATTGTLTFNVANDLKTEGTESFFVTLDSATGATLGSTTAVLATINDTSLSPTLTPVHTVTISSTDSNATYLGETGETGVTRISLAGLGLSTIRSIRIEDDNFISGGDGIASGYDLDFVKFSTQQTSSASASTTLADNSINFSSTTFKAGYLQPVSSWSSYYGTVLYGSNTDGTANVGLDNFGVKDGANNSGVGSLSLGEAGAVSFNLTQALTPSSDLYLYVGDVGGGNDNFRVVFSDQLANAADSAITLKGDSSDNSIRLGESINANLGKGNDTIYGYGGADDLYTAGADDLLLGGTDNDTLDGGAGNDTMQGEAGNDIYYFGAGSGNDVIIDVEGNDTLILKKLASTDVTFERVADHPNDVKLIINTTKESVYLTDQLNPIGSLGIERFTFTDKSLTEKNVSDALSSGVTPDVNHAPTEIATSSTSHAKIYFKENDSIVVANSGVNVYGSKGNNETVTVVAGSQGVILDGNVDEVTFVSATGANANNSISVTGAASNNYTFKQAGNALQIYDSSGQALLVSVPVQDDSNNTLLNFSDGVFSAKLVPTSTGLTIRVNDVQVSSSSPMSVTSNATSTNQLTNVQANSSSNVYLTADDPITVSNDGLSVFGSKGNETVTLTQSAKNIVLDQNIEHLVFQQNESDYKFAQSGNSVAIYDSSATSVIATIPVQDNGTLFTFNDNAAIVTLSPTATGLNMLLGDFMLKSTPTSPSSGTRIDIRNSGVDDAGNGNKQFFVYAGNYSHEIKNFQSGDIINFPSGQIPSLINSNLMDGKISLQYASNGQTAIIDLTGLANDASLGSISGFNNAFGSASIGSF